MILIVTVSFMFGLCFVQASTSYINENKATISEASRAPERGGVRGNG